MNISFMLSRLSVGSSASCMMEIDDDDEDVIQVSIDVANEAAMPIGGLDIFIKTSDNGK